MPFHTNHDTEYEHDKLGENFKWHISQRKSIFKLTVSVGASRNHIWICMASNRESHMSTFLTGVTLTQDRKAINQ